MFDLVIQPLKKIPSTKLNPLSLKRQGERGGGERERERETITKRWKMTGDFLSKNLKHLSQKICFKLKVY